MEEVLEYLEQVTNLELILIPANTFVMGWSEPRKVECVLSS